VLRTAKTLTREEECERILKVGEDDYELVFRALDVQFKLLHNRAQVILGICGVLVSASVLLMSAKLVMRSPVAHKSVITPLLLSAGAAAIGGAAVLVGGVLRIRWTTELPGADLRAWVMSSLAYRDAKTAIYRLGTMILLLSMALFETAALLSWIL
jgi:hypothetical protein